MSPASSRATRLAMSCESRSTPALIARSKPSATRSTKRAESDTSTLIRGNARQKRASTPGKKVAPRSFGAVSRTSPLASSRSSRSIAFACSMSCIATLTFACSRLPASVSRTALDERLSSCTPSSSSSAAICLLTVDVGTPM